VVSEPLVLLVVQDEAVRASIREAVSDAGVRFSEASDLEDAVRRARTEQPPIIILRASEIEDAGLGFVKAASKNSPAPRVLVLFDDVDDPRRADVIASGAIAHVSGGDHSALAALVERARRRQGLQGRLDAINHQVRALVENSNDAVYILRGPRFAYANPRFEELTGYSLNELLADDFQIGDKIIAPESRVALEERQRRIQQGMTVEPRYEFTCLRRDGTTFDAQVSVSYIEFEGAPATLGLITDITQRKQFEQMLVRKNRELALLNELAAAINRAVDIDETLRVGCKRAAALLGASGVGLSLFSADRRFLKLRMHDGLGDAAVEALARVGADDQSLLSMAVRDGDVQLVADVRSDERVTLREVKDKGFGSAAVIPLKAESRVLGAVFFFTPRGVTLAEEDRDLMKAVGHLLGTSIHKAELLDHSREAYSRLRAVDDVALAIVAELEADHVAETVARRVNRMFGCERVMITRWNPDQEVFEPLCALDGAERTQLEPLARNETLMGDTLETGEHALVVHPQSPWRRFHESMEAPPPYEERLFEEGFGCACAIPVVADDEVIGALHLSHVDQRPLPEAQLDALSMLSTHVAIAMKNADVLASKEQALEDLKAAQRKLVESERLKALGELSAGVAHDFNNVLGAILGRAQLLDKHLTDPALRKHAAVIEKAAQDGAETVRRVQELGKGKREGNHDFTDVDVAEILRDVIEITMTRWRDHTRAEGRTVDVNLVDNGDVTVRGNPHELREVLINLVHNAVDAMPHGGVITVSYEVDRGLVAIRVRDTGTGIPEKVRKSIFDPFFTTKGDKGTGLGLSVSHSIIKRHGGELSCDSVTEGENTGTTFTIELPRAPVDPSGRANKPPVSSGSAPEAEAPAEPVKRVEVEDDREPDKARVLVIDDEENIREILQDFLETDGHEVVACDTGQSGLGELERGRAFDLVLTDLSLPGMSGWDICEKVKAGFPNVTVGLITGWGATLDADKARESGVDHVLSKPFRFDQLVKVVEEALGRRAG
jgi:PAS domain S-box-containing protein